MGRGCNPRGQNCRRRFSNASWILEQVGHVLEQGKGREGLLGRGVSVSACAYTLSRSAYCLLPTAYCLLPTACAVLLSAMYVYVCVCAESIHVVKQFYLGPRCVCVCGPTTRMVRPQSYRSSSRASLLCAIAATVAAAIVAAIT